jgi:proteasome beta subunit
MIPSIVGTLVGGFNEDGTTELYTIIPDGTIEKIEDYDANVSSGMPYMLGLLERQYKQDLTSEEGVKLAIDCIKASSERDVGSGFGIDVFVITKQGIKQVSKQRAQSIYKEE